MLFSIMLLIIDELVKGINIWEVVVRMRSSLTKGEIDWEHPGIHRGNLITCAGSERVTDRVCSIKENSGELTFFLYQEIIILSLKL